MRIQEARSLGRQRLREVETPGLDADILLGHVMGVRRETLLTADDALTPAQEQAFLTALASRESGIPVAYVTGNKSWLGIDILVSPDVLIPRPETEILAEAAIALAGRRNFSFAIDVGTGSGAIAIALALHVPDLQVIGTDISGSALAVARRNATRHGVTSRVRFLQGDLVEPVTAEPELLVANLPYICDADEPALRPEVSKEPPRALFGGPDGLDVIRRLLMQLNDRHWRPPFALEIDPRQVAPLKSMFEEDMPGCPVRVVKDLGGRDRLLLVGDW